MRLFSVIIVLFFSTMLPAQQKYALLVAIGQYPQGAGLPPIAAVNDIRYIKAALYRHGFTEKNMTTLVNAKATKDAIIKALISLAARIKKNDKVVISFGCHGQQIRDQKTPALGKDEDDGYDEALLPYDAKGRYNPTGYRGEKHLRDDELYPLLLSIRQKAGTGGSVMILLDACHSGTGTRAEGFAIVRGDPVPFPDPENPIDTVVSMAAAESRQGFFEDQADSLSNMVVISGSGPHQENKQLVINQEDLGSLSYAFYTAMSDLAPGNNYGILFEKIKAIIQAYIPDQVPLLEGNPRQVIFSGQYTPMEEKLFLRVGNKAVPAANDSLFTIEKGLMDHLTVGATCKIFKAGNPSVFAEGTIRRVDQFSSVGIANRILTRTELYEVKLNESQFGEFKAGLKLSFESQPLPLVEKQVKELIQPYHFLTLSPAADFQLDIKREQASTRALLTDRNNQLLWSAGLASPDSLSGDDQRQLIAGIKKAMRVKFLRTLPDGGDLAAWVNVDIQTELLQDTLRGIELGEGDIYALRIRNNAPYKLFYTVLDIYPDNRVEVLYPGKGKDPSDYNVDKQSTVIRKLAVSKGTPAGREFLKVIVSREPLDLRSVIEQKTERDELRSFQLVMDDLFNESGTTATRSDVSTIKAEEIGIRTVHFNIRKE
ncbi:MAG: caspase family protein [Bacteroidetes bacterium]|nr:caspase family protein [Bacteroidota bacterium]